MTDVAKTETDVANMFARAAERLENELAGVERGWIMNSEGLKTAGGFCAFVTRGELVVKLPAARVAELVAGGAGQPFDAGKGRPMREWVRLAPGDEAACQAYVREASEFVAGLAVRRARVG